jgi:hypothetical protein
MEIHLRAALLDWLRTAPAPIADLNLVEEQETSRASMPWLALVASASADWSAKDRHGREIRVAFELNHRGDAVAALADTVAAIEDRVLALPPGQPGFTVVTIRFLRARSERRANNVRATLVEFAFRCLATP